MAEDDQRRDGEGVFNAWSRRKRAARKTDEAREVETAEQNAQETKTGAAAEPEGVEVDEQYLASLPTIDDITGQTDLQPFLKHGVPSALRNAAMRKVWLANALIRDHDDPAVDYAWDWNAPEGVPGAGGTLNREGVTKMVKDLVNRERPDDPEQSAQAEARSVEGVTDEECDAPIADDRAEEDQKDEEAVPQTSSVRRTDPAAPAATASAEDLGDPIEDGASVSTNTDNRAQVGTARHGGAIPKT